MDKKQALNEKNIRNLENKIMVVTGANKEFKVSNKELERINNIVCRILVWLAGHSKLVDNAQKKVIKYVKSKQFEKLNGKFKDFEISGS